MDASTGIRKDPSKACPFWVLSQDALVLQAVHESEGKRWFGILCVVPWCVDFIVDVGAIHHSRATVIFLWAISVGIELEFLKSSWLREVHKLQHIDGKMLQETPTGGRHIIWRDLTKPSVKSMEAARWIAFVSCMRLQASWVNEQLKYMCVLNIGYRVCFRLDKKNRSHKITKCFW